MERTGLGEHLTVVNSLRHYDIISHGKSESATGTEETGRRNEGEKKHIPTDGLYITLPPWPKRARRDETRFRFLTTVLRHPVHNC